MPLTTEQTADAVLAAVLAEQGDRMSAGALALLEQIAAGGRRVAKPARPANERPREDGDYALRMARGLTETMLQQVLRHARPEAAPAPAGKPEEDEAGPHGSDQLRVPTGLRVPRPSGDVLHGGQWIEARALAQFYSQIFNDLQAAGKPPEEQAVEDANGEVQPHGWSVEQNDRGVWEAVDMAVEEAAEPGDGPMQHKRVPKDTPGAIQKPFAATSKYAGKFYYVDANTKDRGSKEKVAAHKASAEAGKTHEEVKAKIEKLHAEHAERSKASREQFYAPPELSPQGRKKAAAMLKMIQRHYGGDAVHRLDMMAHWIKDALEATNNEDPDKGTVLTDQSRKDLLNKNLLGDLARLHAMIGMAGGGKGEAKKEEAAAAAAAQPPAEVVPASAAPGKVDYGNLNAFAAQMREPLKKAVEDYLQAAKEWPDAKVQGAMDHIKEKIRSKGDYPGGKDASLADINRRMGLETILDKRAKAGVKVGEEAPAPAKASAKEPAPYHEAGADKARTAAVEDAILAATGSGAGASRYLIVQKVREKTPDATEEEIRAAGARLLKDGRVVLKDGKAHKVEAPAEAHQAIRRLHSSLEGSGLPPEKKKAYGEAMARATARMPAGALDRLGANLKGATFHASIASIGQAAVDEALRTPGLTDQQRSELEAEGNRLREQDLRPGGAFTNGHMHVDGGYDVDKWMTTGRYATDKWMHAHEVYAHELGHAIDGEAGLGPDRLSMNEAWTAAYYKEIKSRDKSDPLNPKVTLTGYARTNRLEGFAEFSRLLYASDVPLEEIERNFPGCSAFFKEKNLWPEEKKSSKPGAEMVEVFDERVQLPGGEDNHIDGLKAEGSPSAETPSVEAPPVPAKPAAPVAKAVKPSPAVPTSAKPKPPAAPPAGKPAPGGINEAILAAVGGGHGLDRTTLLAKVKEAMPGAGDKEISEAKDKLLKTGKIGLKNGKAFPGKATPAPEMLDAGKIPPPSITSEKGRETLQSLMELAGKAGAKKGMAGYQGQKAPRTAEEAGKRFDALDLAKHPDAELRGLARKFGVPGAGSLPRQSLIAAMRDKIGRPIQMRELLGETPEEPAQEQPADAGPGAGAAASPEPAGETPAASAPAAAASPEGAAADEAHGPPDYSDFRDWQEPGTKLPAGKLPEPTLPEDYPQGPKGAVANYAGAVKTLDADQIRREENRLAFEASHGKNPAEAKERLALLQAEGRRRAAAEDERDEKDPKAVLPWETARPEWQTPLHESPGLTAFLNREFDKERIDLGSKEGEDAWEKKKAAWEAQKTRAYEDKANAQPGLFPQDRSGPGEIKSDLDPITEGLGLGKAVQEAPGEKPPVAPSGDKETHWQGDRARYTGKTRMVGGKPMHEIEILEGASKGLTKLTARGPDGSDPYAEQAKKDWQEQQEGFRRLRDGEKPPVSPPGETPAPAAGGNLTGEALKRRILEHLQTAGKDSKYSDVLQAAGYPGGDVALKGEARKQHPVAQAMKALKEEGLLQTTPSTKGAHSLYGVTGEGERRLARPKEAAETPATPVAAGEETAYGEEGVAKKPDEPPSPEKQPAVVKAHVALASALAERLKAGEKITPEELRKMAAQHFGGTQASGAHTYHQMTQAVEAGFNKSLQGKTNPATASLDDALQQAQMIAAQVQALPKMDSVRDGNQESHQQFSTPPHYAFAAAWAANLTPEDVVLEPSAGTGCLAVQAANTGADVVVNEKDEQRADFLADLFGSKKVHVLDAAQISKILPGRGVGPPTTVIMNPPFSREGDRMGAKKILGVGASHIDEALRMLAPGGRLVAIVGRGMTEDSPTFQGWFAKLKKDHALRANVGVSGDEYKKYGTSFGTRLLVIDKTGPHTGETVQGDAADVPSLMKALEAVRNDRPRTTGRPPGEPAGPGVAEETPRVPVPGNDPAAGVPAGVPGQPAAAGLPGAAELPRGRAEPGAEPGEQPGSDAGGHAPDGGLAAAPERPEGSGAGQRVAGAAPAPGQPGAQPPAKPQRQRGGKGAGGKPLQQLAPGGGLRPPGPVKVEAVKAAPVDAPLGKPDEQGPQEQTTQKDLGPSLYEAYRPQLLRVPGARAHPTPLVESSAMSAVHPPEPTYAPHLSPDVVEKGILSEAQLESLVYAGQAHGAFLPATGGTAMREGMFVLDPGGQRLYLNKQPSGEWTIEGTPYRFPSAEAVQDFLAKGWKTSDGERIKQDKSHRRGYFIGDGTGTGKGRQIAGVISDNWAQGRRRHVWISQKQDLLKDAHRDFTALGMATHEDYKKDGRLIHFDRIRKGAAPPGEGVGFITYDTLKGDSAGADGQKLSNIEHLARWLGEDFEGVIAMDEAHGMGNAIETEGKRGKKAASARAQAGLDLQRRFPKARILYVSATGATEVANLAYAERLGIWGNGTSFSGQGEFISQMNDGGVAAMEAVAQSLKAMGCYTARSLTFDDGSKDENGGPGLGVVQYDRLGHTLTADQHEQYNSASDAWQKVLANIDKALEITNGTDSPTAKKNATGQFWGAQQRFFNQVMTAMQTPTTIQEMMKDVEEGRSPVVQLTGTGAASLERAKAARTEDMTLDDMDVSPTEILVAYLEKSFPVNQHETYTNEEGKDAVREVRTPVVGPDGKPVLDARGNPVTEAVLNPEAVALRDEMIQMVKMNLRMSESPLDMIHRAFTEKYGHGSVAEATGRKERFVWKENPQTGKLEKQLENRPDGAKAADAARFQAGEAKALVFSDAGGTGSSYHADRGAANQGRRVHYLLQPGWRADNAVQGLGRTHRTNQSSAPLYRLVQIEDLPAQKRFLSTIARRLDQLGALTKGQRQAGGGGLFNAADNLESAEASLAMDKLFRDLSQGKVQGLNFEQVMTQMGLNKNEDPPEEEVGGWGRRGKKKEAKVPKPADMNQFLNRLLVLRPDMQRAVFDHYEQYLADVVEQARRDGTLDTGVENFPADRVTRVNERTVYREPSTGAEVRHITTAARRIFPKVDFAEATHTKPLFFARSKATGNIFAVRRTTASTNAESGRVIAQYRIVGPTSSDFVPQSDVESPHGEYYNKFEKIEDPKAAQEQWDREFSEAPDHIDDEEHFVTGALLPIWKKIPGETPKIYRLKTDDGQTVVGRHVPRHLVGTMLKRLGFHEEGGVAHATPSVHSRLSAGQVHATLGNGWKLKPVRVQGERRIELMGGTSYGQNIPFSAVKQLEDSGVVVQKIGGSGQPRFFVPTGPGGVQVLERIIKDRAAPITDVEGMRSYSKQDAALHYDRLSRAALSHGDQASARIYARQAREAMRG